MKNKKHYDGSASRMEVVTDQGNEYIKFCRMFVNKINQYRESQVAPTLFKSKITVGPQELQNDTAMMFVLLKKFYTAYIEMIKETEPEETSKFTPRP